MHSFIFTQTTLDSAWDKIKTITGFNSHEDSYHHPDIFILQPEINEKTVKKTGSIKIESVRELQTKLAHAPLRLQFQIGIIEEADLLTLPAQQSLLKLLEEPKNNTFLFLITKGSHHVFLPTILSRCQLVTGTMPVGSQNEGDEATRQLQELTTFSTAKRMKFFESLGTGDKANLWLKATLPYLQKSLHQMPSPALINLIQNVQTALNDIQANVNTKLVLDQLAIHWDGEKLDGNR